MTESAMAAQALLPPHRPLLDFFARALASFQHSNAKFQVICTAPPIPSSPDADSHVSAATQTSRSATLLPEPIPPRKRPRTIVVLDSSYNPPTLAHMRMATSAIRELHRVSGQDERGRSGGLRLLLLLAINNADKAPKPAAFEHRLAMMWAFALDTQQAVAEAQTRAQGQKQGSVARTADEAAAAAAAAREEKQQGAGGALRAGGEEEEHSGVSIDIALSTQPYFHEKSASIAEAPFYRPGAADEEGSSAGAEVTPPPPPPPPPTEQVILAGYDTLIRIFNPKYYGGAPASLAQVAEPPGETPIQRALDALFRRAKLRVTMRTDAEWGGRHEQTTYLEDLVRGEGLVKIGGRREWAARIEMVDGQTQGGGNDVVSSTLAREAARKGNWELLAKMVPVAVGSWIQGERLYQGGA